METRQPQFYKKVVPLNSERHADAHIDPAAGYGFAGDATAVLLTTVEFNKTAREYPIVFLEDGVNLNPVALLGLPGSRNRFVTDDGGWRAEYIPAYVRRYPFIPGTSGSTDELHLCIDEEAPSLNPERGEALFQEDGQHTPFLQSCIRMMQEYQMQVQRTADFSNRLKKLKLLVPMKASLTVEGGAAGSLSGFQLVDKARLKALRPKQLADLVKKDEMDAIYAHLMSLDNFRRLTPQLVPAAEEAQAS